MLRRSGLQGDVLSLYRQLLREANLKDQGSSSPSTFAFVREKFRGDAMSTRRADFKRVEFLLRQVCDTFF